MYPNPKPSSRPQGGTVPPAETEAARIREIKSAAHRLGASRRMVAAAVATGVSSENAAAMFEAASQTNAAAEPVEDLASRRRWEADDALRAEFGTLERYSAWAKAQATGRVRTSAPVVMQPEARVH